ncbi:MAG: hypothetical protein OEZ65_17265, partial [Gemmatimonadota bacterium]|nr:hypothetical protein [Gemmatimonadota bacterium]
PSGSIKIRVETIDYFLRRYRDGLVEDAEIRRTVERELEAYRKATEADRAATELVQIEMGRVG